MAGTSRGTMNRKKGPPTQAFWLGPLLFFLALDIILTLIFGSFEMNSKIKQDFEEDEEGESQWESPEPSWSISCDRSHFEYDLCYVNRPAVFDPKTATLTSVDPTGTTPPLVEKIRPYPRKWQHNAMETVKEVTLTTSSPSPPPCDVTHTSPVLLFSAGGFTSNVFHDFCEGFIPLYVTVLTYFKDQDVVLAIVNCDDWWVKKYGDLTQQFTRHPIVNLDKETQTHCFPSAIVGLMSHGPMIVDPTLQRGPNPKSTLDFHDVLVSTYNKSYEIHTRPKPTRPHLVLMSRTTHRVILNQDEVIRTAKGIGFDVTAFEPTPTTPVEEIFRVIDSSHVMMGVHGAGLTNELFLRPGSVLVQIVPLRNSWLGDICYGKLAIRLGLDYFIYDITSEESSLFGKYPPELVTPNDQGGMLMGGFSHWDIYMNQNVTLDLDRFKRYLERAYHKAKIFMETENMQ